jgi:hypothetical protein
MVNAPVRLNYRMMEGIDDMRLIYARYNSNCNSIDITTFDNILLRIEWNKAEEGTRTTPGSQCALNALAIDEPLEYARLALDGEMQMWVDAEDSLELW